MPTGYTSYILDGKIDNGKDFLKLCTRAFGVAVNLRDESLSVSTPIEVQPDNFYKNSLEKTKEELNKYLNMSIEEAQKIIDGDYEKSIQDAKKYIKENLVQKERYEKVLQEVVAWNPPTKEHQGIKDYAINQIKESIEWDCTTVYYTECLGRPKLEVNEWLALQIKCCSENIERYTKHYNEELQRVARRNKWMKDFVNSLE